MYDKHAGARFRPNIRNVLAERAFYDLPAQNAFGGSLETGLQRIEDLAVPLLREVVRQKNIAFFVRTREHRLRYENLGQLIKQRLLKMNASEQLLKSFDSDEDDSKMAGLQDIVLLVPQFAPHFLNKHWALFEAPPGLSMYTSDNPVTLHNELDLSP